MPRAPPMNFTGKSAFHGMSRSPRSTASMWGMPLPGASGAKRTVSQPVVHPTARPKERQRHPPPVRMRVGDGEKGEPHVVDAVDGPAEEQRPALPPAPRRRRPGRSLPALRVARGASSARVSLGSFVGSTTSEILPDQVVANGQSISTPRPRRDRAARPRSRNRGIARSRGAGTRLASIPPDRATDRRPKEIVWSSPER